VQQRPDGKHQAWWQQLEGKYWNYFVPDKIMQPYCVEDIYDRYAELVENLKKKTLPAKDFSNNWDKDYVEQMWSWGKLGKTKYEAWQKNPEKYPCGNWQCSYCDWKKQCELDEITFS
jgi:hypothetical protein